MKKALTLSIVIPAYNEESHLRLCLDSIASQSVKPDEVIVVNNNSIDGTAKVASSYEFVKLLHEREQGLIPARNLGFKHAKGDIFARINADAVLNPDWVRNAKKIFAENEQAGGITGPARALVIPGYHHLHSMMWSKIYFRVTQSFFRVPVMWGANMAIRHDVWQKIKSEADLEDSFVHEDQDLSLLLAKHSYQIINSEKIAISTDEQSYFYWPKLKEYLTRQRRTKLHHKEIGSYNTVEKQPLWKSSALILTMFIPSALFLIASLVVYYITRILYNK